MAKPSDGKVLLQFFVHSASASSFASALRMCEGGVCRAPQGRPELVRTSNSQSKQRPEIKHAVHAVQDSEEGGKQVI
ncbi:hypothetical protein H0H87_011497 [Tephrocybe sp. NHM501043]|nr:hypothetical protein H0H87_011497 [Tephrocybe sp. NHM501043]